MINGERAQSVKWTHKKTNVQNVIDFKQMFNMLHWKEDDVSTAPHTHCGFRCELKQTESNTEMRYVWKQKRNILKK